MSPFTCDSCAGEIAPDEQFRVQVICMACAQDSTPEDFHGNCFPDEFADIDDEELDDAAEPWLEFDDDDIPPPPPWDEFPPSR